MCKCQLVFYTKVVFHFVRDVLLRNGTAVDAAVAALFCNGVHVCHSMGIGGGLIMTIYQKSTGKVDTLIARERAPGAAHKDMFHGDSDLSVRGKGF